MLRRRLTRVEEGKDQCSSSLVSEGFIEKVSCLEYLAKAFSRNGQLEEKDYGV